MANTLSGIIPILIARALQVLREQCVMPRLVNTDFALTPANEGDTVNVWVASAMSATDVVPSATPLVGSDSKPVRVPIPLNKWKHSGFFMTDKEAAEIVKGFVPKQAEEAIRSLANQVNADLFATYPDIYGFVGTPGTTPFSTANDLSDAINARKVLGQQLAPFNPRFLVLDPTAEAKALAQDSIQKAYARGDGGKTLMEGQIGRLLGFDWWMDQQVPTHVGSAPFSTGAATVNGVQAVGVGSTDDGRTGTLSIAKATATHNLVRGDVITIAGDAQTYSVVADVTLAIGNTTVTITPALRKATVGAEAISLKAAHVVNLAFHQDAIAFASRPIAALGFTETTGVMGDPVSKLSVRLEITRQYKQTLYDFDLLYGSKLVRPELAVRVAG